MLFARDAINPFLGAYLQPSWLKIPMKATCEESFPLALRAELCW